MTRSIKTGGTRRKVEMDICVENARAKRAIDAFPAEFRAVNASNRIDTPSEANIRDRSTAVFSKVEVDRARDGRNR